MDKIVAGIDATHLALGALSETLRELGKAELGPGEDTALVGKLLDGFRDTQCLDDLGEDSNLEQLPGRSRAKLHEIREILEKLSRRLASRETRTGMAWHKCRKHNVEYELREADRGKTIQVCPKCEEELHERYLKAWREALS